MPGLLQVHQSLHGYADGHTQIAASVRLNPRDARTMLVLSDLAGTGGAIPEDGYVTGYPLADAGFYVLAKTWEATEMRRPGCVWTHSILIPFSDLAWIEPLIVASAFRRPGSLSFSDYRQKLAIGPQIDREIDFFGDLDIAKRLISALYKHPRKSVFLEDSSIVDIEHTVLMIWSQQWPKLKRGFRFCTSTTVERTHESATFDLLITRPSSRNLQAAFKNSLNVTKLKLDTGGWLNVAVADLIERDHKLAEFLRNVGVDVNGGREAFPVLVDLFSVLQRKDKYETGNDLILLLERNVFSSDARIARGIVVNAALMDIENLSLDKLQYFLTKLDWLDPTAFQQNAVRIGRDVWKRLPDTLAVLAQGEGRTWTIATSTIAVLSPQEIFEGCRRDPETLIWAVGERPDILQYDEAWAFEFVDLTGPLLNATFEPELGSNVLASLMRSARPEMANAAIERFGIIEVWQELSRHLGFADAPLSSLQRSLLDTILSDTSLVASLLTDGKITSWAIAAMVTSRTYPDSIPNDYGADPWASTLSKLTENKNEVHDLNVECYLLARAFGYKTRDPATLARLTFASVYEAAKYNKIDYKSWSFLEHKLPSSFFSNWDRCKRLREGVSELFSYNHLSEFDYVNLIYYHNDFRDLVATTVKSYTGEKYIKEVKQYLKHEYYDEEKLSIVKSALKDKW